MKNDGLIIIQSKDCLTALPFRELHLQKLHAAIVISRAGLDVKAAGRL
ncbi:hypothetical protein V2O64_24805 (plasmid) [Verrucomicrobiaceae bacterium 227]